MPIAVSDAFAAWEATRNRIDAELCPEWAHDGQREVWDDDRQDIIACAGTQGGKTALNPYWLLREISRTAGLAKQLGVGNYIYAGPTLTLLEAQAIPAFEALFVDELKLGKLIKGTKPKFYFSPEGATRICGSPVKLIVHFAYANDSQNLESMTALAAVWDEVGQRDNKEASYEAMNRRLKVARSQGAGRRLFTTTPYEWGWFKFRVVDYANKIDTFGYHSWASWLNPLMDESAVRKELELGMERWRWEMMYEGKWTRPAGAVYDCFDARIESNATGETNVVEPFKIPDNWRLYAGWDFGSANTAAVILARNPETDVFYLCKSYHGSGEHPATHIDRVDGLLAKKNGVKRKIHYSFGGASSEDDFRDSYLFQGQEILKPLVSGSGSVAVGVSATYRAISTKKLKVFSSETELIEQMQGYSYKMTEDGKILDEIKDKALFHRLDALRYAIVSLVDLPKPSIKGSRFDSISRV